MFTFLILVISVMQQMPEVTVTPLGKQAALNVWLKEAGPDCGANCAYVYLKLLGKNCDIAAVRSKVDIGEKGASIQELLTCVTSYGVKSQVVSCPTDSLGRCLPCIAFLREEGVTESGHFVVVTHMDGQKVWTIDGTVGNYSVIPVEYSPSRIPGTPSSQSWRGRLL